MNCRRSATPTQSIVLAGEGPGQDTVTDPTPAVTAPGADDEALLSAGAVEQVAGTGHTL